MKPLTSYKDIKVKTFISEENDEELDKLLDYLKGKKILNVIKIKAPINTGNYYTITYTLD